MNADTGTEQAQHQMTNDTPTDVNINAVIAREQSNTFVLMGKTFADNADRRSKMFDHFAARMASKDA